MTEHDLQMLLHSRSSLTKALRACAQKSFGVKVLFEGFSTIQKSDQLDYLAPPGTLAWHRQVALMVDEVCWVHGFTWVPWHNLQGAARQLLYLKSRPLGDVLFRDPHLKRSDFIFSLDGLARTSVFTFYKKSLAVREVFLIS